MILRIIFHIILVLLTFGFQLSVLNGFWGWLGFLNLGLVILIFVLELNGFYWGLGWALGLGVLYDIFYFQTFGIFILSFLLAALVSQFLLSKFFTNRSLYSYLALIVAATIFLEIFPRLLIFILNFYSTGSEFFLASKDFAILLGKSLLVNGVAVFISFYLFNFLSTRFNEVFLRK